MTRIPGQDDRLTLPNGVPVVVDPWCTSDSWIVVQKKGNPMSEAETNKKKAKAELPKISVEIETSSVRVGRVILTPEEAETFAGKLIRAARAARE